MEVGVGGDRMSCLCTWAEEWLLARGPLSHSAVVTEVWIETRSTLPLVPDVSHRNSLIMLQRSEELQQSKQPFPVIAV